jgi:hypothetical protein
MLFCAASLAQEQKPRYELGFHGGVGQYSYTDDKGYNRGVLGAEGCAFCGGRYALFGSYSHFLAPGHSSAYHSADLMNSGLRIQGRGRVSAFFDVGFAVGFSRFGYGGYRRELTTAGAALGGGVTFRFAKGLYIRPQVHVSAMSSYYLAAGAEMAIGWRF